MQINRTLMAVFASFLMLFGLMLLLGTMSGPAYAQDELVPKTATPRPIPKNNGGKAKWAIKKSVFKSNYPNGFEFSVEASSTGGKIIGASAVWQHSPSMGRRAPGKINPSGKISAVWEGSDLPQWVGLNYRWQFEDEAGNQFETLPIYAEYEDNTRLWHRAESEDAIVHWQDGVPDAVGPLVIEAMSKNRTTYYQNWGKLLNYRPVVIIYADFESWSEWSPGAGTTAPGGVRTVGQTSASWGGTVQVYLPRGGPEGLAYGTVLHEVGHLYQFFNGGAAGDCWFFEGDATYFEVSQSYDYLAAVQDMANDGSLPTLQNGGPSCRGSNAREAYDIGYAFFKYLAEVYGPQAHRELWALIGRGKTSKQAMEEITQMGFVEMETDFRTWLGMQDPEAPTPMPTMEFTFPPTPTYVPVKP